MQMFRTFIIALAALVSLTATAHADLKVVATVPDLAAIAHDVGGSHVSVIAMALPTQDPHFVDAKPSLALHVSRADLLIAVGMDLEVGWLPTLQVGARNAKVQVGARGFLDCGALVRPLDVPTTKLDRASGDIHPQGNPHYLYDPRQAALVAAGIAARMAELDPSNAADYQKNLKTFLAALESARAGWEKQLAPLRGQPVVTYHKSLVYLADWLGFEVIATLEPKPGIPPTSKHVAVVLSAGRKKGVKLLLQEQFYPDSTSKLLAKKLPAQLVMLPGGTDFKAGQSYLQHMDGLVAQLAAAYAEACK
jgi:zinc/manganese transport system substrate-binding protein